MFGASFGPIEGWEGSHILQTRHQSLRLGQPISYLTEVGQDDVCRRLTIFLANPTKEAESFLLYSPRRGSVLLFGASFGPIEGWEQSHVVSSLNVIIYHISTKFRPVSLSVIQ